MVARSSGDDGARLVSISGPSPRALSSDLVHGDALVATEQIAVEFDGIHDHDFFDLSLGKDRNNLVQLLVGRKKDGAAPESIEHEGSLFGSERGVERNRHGAEQQARDVGRGPLWTVLAKEGDAISRPNAPGWSDAERCGRRFGQIRGTRSEAIFPRRGEACMRSELRSTAAKKMSFSVARPIAVTSESAGSRKPALNAMYCLRPV